jgi:hypothetical protein
MYFVYLDESGTGNPAKEPFVIVAGVLVNADTQWRSVEKYLSDMADDFAEPDNRPGFVFHAKDLRVGGKRIPRERYSLDKRHRFLQILCEIPSKFNLQIVVGAAKRGDRATYKPEPDDKQLLAEALMLASGTCALVSDEYMKLYRPSEVASLVYEQNGDFSKAVRSFHNFLRSDSVDKYQEGNPGAKVQRFERVIETAMFVGKGDSSPLQIADACAYILGRRMRRESGDERFYEPLRPFIRRAPSYMFSDLKVGESERSS